MVYTAARLHHRTILRIEGQARRFPKYINACRPLLVTAVVVEITGTAYFRSCRRKITHSWSTVRWEIFPSIVRKSPADKVDSNNEKAKETSVTDVDATSAFETLIYLFIY